jgi:hypothetical protein
MFSDVHESVCFFFAETCLHLSSCLHMYARSIRSKADCVHLREEVGRSKIHKKYNLKIHLFSKLKIHQYLAETSSSQ